MSRRNLTIAELVAAGLLALVLGCVPIDTTPWDAAGKGKVPFPNDGLTVLMMEDSAPEARQGLSKAQTEILDSTKAGSVRSWCEANCVKSSAGVPRVRTVSIRNLVVEREDKVWQDAIKAKPADMPLPCMIAANGKKPGIVSPIPPNTTPAAVIQTLEKLKGK